MAAFETLKVPRFEEYEDGSPGPSVPYKDRRKKVEDQGVHREAATDEASPSTRCCAQPVRIEEVLGADNGILPVGQQQDGASRASAEGFTTIVNSHNDERCEESISPGSIEHPETEKATCASCRTSDTCPTIHKKDSECPEDEGVEARQLQNPILDTNHNTERV